MMSGDRLSAVCKTVSSITGVMPLQTGNVTKVIDESHTRVMYVRSKDGSDVLGTPSLGGDWGVHIKDVLKMRLEDEGDFEASMVGMTAPAYVLSGPQGTYRFRMADRFARLLRPITFDDSGHSSMELDTKALLRTLERAMNVSDHMTIRAEDGHVHIVAEDGLGNGMDRDLGPVTLMGRMCTDVGIDLMRDILKVAGKRVTLRIGLNSLAVIEWSDTWYDYTAMIAPRLDGD